MFTGFSDQTLDFLYGIHFNNNRLWFENHKDDYKNHLLAPLRELSREVFGRLIELEPDRELISKVARIYKDARLYRGDQPYKEELWFSIRPPVELWEDAPCFWFGLHREEWTYGLGFYAPKAATMARHRALIDKNPAPLQRLWDGLLRQTEFELAGESYARFKPCATLSLAGWYNMKGFSLIHRDNDMAPLCSPGLVDRVTDGFRFLMPYFDYFYPLCEGAQAHPASNFH